jgi:hypothetical protein
MDRRLIDKGLLTSGTPPPREIIVRLDNKTWNKLVSKHREIQEEFGDESYSLEDYVYETIYDDLFDSDIISEEKDLVETISDNPGITLRELFDKVTSR